MTHKICLKCKESKHLEYFTKDKQKSTGFSPYCKVCNYEHVSLWRKTNPEKNKAWRHANRDKLKGYTNLEKLAIWKVNNKNKIAKYARDFKARNPEKVRLTKLLYKRRIRKSVPTWVDRNILMEFIAACPPGYHVDHIIPLKGKEVSGLTVLENLQYLTSHENLTKSNRIDAIPQYPCCQLKQLDRQDNLC